MSNTAIADALALRTMASSLDAHRGKLPVLGDRHRSPEPIQVSRQISQLGKLITELGDEVLFRVAEPNQPPHSARAAAAFAQATNGVGQAAAALGTVNQELLFLKETDHIREQPDAKDAREAAVRCLEDALGLAGGELEEAANCLHAASSTISPPSVRLQAALRRSPVSTATGGPPIPAANTAAAAAPAAHAVRGR